MESKIGTGTADFERDPNQGSLEMSDLQASTKKETRFLLSELKTIKEQLHAKLLLLKARTQGKRGATLSNSTTVTGQFDILPNFSTEDILRKEIDHVFIMTQVLNTVVLKGDATYRTMQELAMLTNE